MSEGRAGVEGQVGAGLGPDELVAVVEHLPVPVAFSGADGAVRFLNRAARERYGLTDDALGRDAVSQLIAPSDTATALEIMESILAGRAWYGSFPVTPPGGERFIGRFLAAPAVVPELGVTGMLSVELVGSGADGAAAAEEERALLTQAEQADLLLEGVLASAPVALAVFDRSLRFVRANPAAAELTGLPVDAHVGRRLGDVRTGLPSSVAEDISGVFATGDAVIGREVEGGAPGRRRHWLVSYCPVRRRGEVLWVGAVAVDITERERAEAERSALLAAEHEARTAAERAAARLGDLQSVTAGLAAARTRQDVAHAVFAATAGLGAQGQALCLVGDGDEVEVAASVGFDPAAVERFRRFSLHDDLPAAEAIRRRRPVLIDSIEERDRRYPQLASFRSSNDWFVVIPLHAHDVPVGCVTLGWAAPPRPGEDDMAFLVAVGQQAAQALERVRFSDAERTAARRQAFLAEASRVLASSSEDGAVLARVAALVVGELADACSVHLLEDGALRCVTAAGVDAGSEELAARLVPEAWAPGPGGVAELVTSVGPLLHAAPPARVPGDAPLAGLGATSLAVLPLRAGERPVGVLAVATAAPGRLLRHADVAVAEDLGARIAVAVDTARSHRERLNLAQTLQRSLLPPALPSIAGIRLAARYHPVRGGGEVGGDFYDVFPLGDGRWGAVIGDVCGNGALAASLTALVRYTVRAEAKRGDAPSRVLQNLHRAVLEQDLGERFCTLVLAYLRALGDEVEVTLACAGHPLPILSGPQGSIRPVGRPGSAVGLVEEAAFTDVVEVVAGGEVLAFYTDGVIEARDPEGRIGDTLLEEALARAAGRDLEAVAASVERAVLAHYGGVPRDDVAFLLVSPGTG